MSENPVAETSTEERSARKVRYTPVVLAGLNPV